MSNRVLEYVDGFLRLGLGWLKAQLIFFVLNMLIISICLTLFGVKLSLLIALGISLLDLLPVVGSGLAFVPWCLIALLAGDPVRALQIGLLYVGLVVLRTILDPLITGKSIGLRPLAALGAAILGMLVLGMTGMVIGPIVAAVVNVIVKVNQRHALEQQNNLS